MRNSVSLSHIWGTEEDGLRTSFGLHFECLAGSVNVGVVDNVGQDEFITGPGDEIWDDVGGALIVGLCCIGQKKRSYS